MAERAPLRVVVAGGGIAAVETLLALRALAGGSVGLTIVAPQDDFVYQPPSVGEPFALGRAIRRPMRSLAGELYASLVSAEAVEVRSEQRRLRISRGRELEYDALVIAVGARREAPFARALLFEPERAHEVLGGLLRDLEEGRARRIGLVIPSGPTWPLPLYELALMIAADASGLGIDPPSLLLASPERSPLAVFGPVPSRAVAERLAGAGIEFAGGVHATVAHGRLLLSPPTRIHRVDRIVTLPVLRGPAVAGLPADADGFVPVDAEGRVAGLDDVYAAGDGTSSGVKHGGVAAQQADAIAAVIASRAGIDVAPAPARPVLHGVLMTGGEPLYLLRDPEGSPAGEAAERPLWADAEKVTARHLGAWLASAATPPGT